MAIFIESSSKQSKKRLSAGEIWRVIKLIILAIIALMITVGGISYKIEKKKAFEALKNHPKAMKLILSAVKQAQSLVRKHITSKYVKWEETINSVEQQPSVYPDRVELEFPIGEIEYTRIVDDVVGNKDWRNQEDGRFTPVQMKEIRKLCYDEIMKVIADINSDFKSYPNGSMIKIECDPTFDWLFGDGSIENILDDAPDVIVISIIVKIYSYDDIEKTDEVKSLKEATGWLSTNQLDAIIESVIL